MEIRGKPNHCQACRLYDAPMVSYDSCQEADIVVLGSYPLEVDVDKAPFASGGGEMVKKVIREIVYKLPRGKQPKIQYMYACKCVPKDFDWKINKEDLDRCAAFLYSRLEALKPKLVIALGSDAAKSLRFTEKHGDLRGGFYERNYNGLKFLTTITYHPSMLFRKPGLMQVFRKDMEKAVDMYVNGFGDQEMDIDTPTTYGEIMDSLDRFEQAIEENWQDHHRPLLVAADTETTSLHPYLPEERVILVSISYRAWQGLAYPWQHRDAPLTAEQFSVIRNRTEQLLGDERIFLAMANAKFDQQWLKYHYSLNIKDVDWDVILQEHTLDEDKKGEYSLKVLTTDYFPWAGKYEKELQMHLDRIRAERSEESRELLADYKERLKEAFVSFWTGLAREERVAMASEWVNAGYLKISDTSDIFDVKTRKLKGEMVITAKYKQAVMKALSRVPEEQLSTSLPELPELPNPKEVTYEDLPLDVLMRYAAIDAVMTRMVVPEQMKKVAEDNAIIKKVEKRKQAKLPTKPLHVTRTELTNPLCRTIAEMEYNGVRMDRDRILQYRKTLLTTKEEVTTRLYEINGVAFNPNPSAPDLARILYQDMGYPVIKRTEGGDPSTDAETLKFLSDDRPSEFLDKVLLLRKVEKVDSTYLKNWYEMSATTGRIHMKFNQNGTATYRLSSSNPNLYEAGGCKTG